MAVPTKEYPYRVRWPLLLLISVGFGAATWFFGQLALTNDRGLVINGIIHFNETYATLFFALLAVLSGAFASVGIIGIIRSGLVPAPMLVLEEDQMRVPSGLFQRHTKIVSFADVKGFEFMGTGGNHLFTVRTANEKAVINSQLLGSKERFEEVCRTIMDRLPEGIGNRAR